MKTDAQAVRIICEGYGVNDPISLAEEFIVDSVAPCICMNDGCNAISELEQDQDNGFCECCGTNSMKSMFILMGIM